MVDDQAVSQTWWPNADPCVDGASQNLLDWEIDLAKVSRGDPLSRLDIFDEPVKVPCAGAFESVEPAPDLPRKIFAEQACLATKNESLALENARLVWENHMLRQQQQTAQQQMGPAGASQWWWPHAEGWSGPVSNSEVQPGSMVCFQNLSITTDLNGACGTVERWDDTSSRWVVRLTSGEEKFAKPDKLILLQEAYGGYGGFCPPAVAQSPFAAWPAFRGGRKKANGEGRRLGSGSTVASTGSDATTLTGSARSSLPSYASDDGAEPGCLDKPLLTTVMMRNIPNDYTRSMLLQLLDSQGFAGHYDLVYLPIDYQSQVGFGYAFIDLVSVEEAEHFRHHFEGFREWGVVSEKICEVCWSNVLQGVQAHIDRYRNSPVMHESVPDEFKPMLFASGERVPFPGPTKSIRPPRLRRKDPK